MRRHRSKYVIPLEDYPLKDESHDSWTSVLSIILSCFSLLVSMATAAVLIIALSV